MQLKMGDFILGMGKDFALKAIEISEKLSLKAGDTLFNFGEPADYFYVLIKGQIKLTLGQIGPVVYVARQPGEVIGWSSLVGREVYSASATCTDSTKLLKFERDEFLNILQKNPANEALLFKRLAEMLGNRLLELYPTIT
ncbi:MAG: cyclic nucleotide-binding domain-containing protein [Desulfobacterales bacterium]|nr:MAG: cyclic nucleotide-binding domain-containing protein [Desulfobacterales bacterium]